MLYQLKNHQKVIKNGVLIRIDLDGT